jgi:hypothetical protein
MFFSLLHTLYIFFCFSEFNYVVVVYREGVLFMRFYGKVFFLCFVKEM